MNMYYSRELKKKLCELIRIDGKSTLKTAEEYKVPIKTLEKWITSYNKNNHCFDPVIEISNDIQILDNFNNLGYDDLSNDELKKVIMKKDIEIARLKKGYTVKEGGMGRKVFVTFFKKNTK